MISLTRQIHFKIVPRTNGNGTRISEPTGLDEQTLPLVEQLEARLENLQFPGQVHVSIIEIAKTELPLIETPLQNCERIDQTASEVLQGLSRKRGFVILDMIGQEDLARVAIVLKSWGEVPLEQVIADGSISELYHRWVDGDGDTDTNDADTQIIRAARRIVTEDSDVGVAKLGACFAVLVNETVERYGVEIGAENFYLMVSFVSDVLKRAPGVVLNDEGLSTFRSAVAQWILDFRAAFRDAFGDFELLTDTKRFDQYQYLVESVVGASIWQDKARDPDIFTDVGKIARAASSD